MAYCACIDSTHTHVVLLCCFHTGCNLQPSCWIHLQVGCWTYGPTHQGFRCVRGCGWGWGCGGGGRVEILWIHMYCCTQYTPVYVQVYTGNNLDGSVYGKGGVPYPKRSGIAMENQQFPNAPNQPNFPSTVLRPGEVCGAVVDDQRLPCTAPPLFVHNNNHNLMTQVYSQEVQYRFSTDGQAC